MVTQARIAPFLLLLIWPTGLASHGADPSQARLLAQLLCAIPLLAPRDTADSANSALNLTFL
jgi:hypothetical protein